MGRNIPVFGDHEQVLVAPHPALSLSLMVLAMATTMAVITGMCGFKQRRAKTTPSSPKQSKDQQDEQNSPCSRENNEESLYEDDQDEFLGDIDGVTSSLPLPPSMHGLDGSNLPQIKPHHKGITKSMSTRNMKRLKSTLNNKVTRSMSVSRHINKAAHNVAHKGHKAAHNVEHIITKPKQEDSLWQKQIILGGKCRVQDDDEDGIIYDPKGNRVQTYHKKTTSSLSMTISRTTSSVDINVIDKEKDIGKKLETEDLVQNIEKKEEES